ncbi:hypothetical protein GGR42_000826 [Saonia flava]|uniref:Uncharacterized protein n=1 Tax=Saonia flava TaxID=523696 RepID=A0A846QZ04_9FLAO|nr:hypothetical protein [Saonia flava]
MAQTRKGFFLFDNSKINWLILFKQLKKLSENYLFRFQKKKDLDEGHSYTTFSTIFE